MTARTLPPARVRTRRLEVDDNAPVADDEARPSSGPEEGAFNYGESFSANPAIRYRQIKSVEGTKAAHNYAKAQMLRLTFGGCSPQECAQTFGFSLTFTGRLIREARAELREKASTQFDAMNVVAEHLMLYQQLRQNAYFTMNKNTVSEVDKHRARESLLSVMRNEIEFVDKMGGLRGITLQGAADDENVLGARRMAERIAILNDALEDVLTGPTDDEEGVYDPGTGPDEDGIYDDERGEAWEPDPVEEENDDTASPLEGPQW